MPVHLDRSRDLFDLAKRFITLARLKRENILSKAPCAFTAWLSANRGFASFSPFDYSTQSMDFIKRCAEHMSLSKLALWVAAAEDPAQSIPLTLRDPAERLGIYAVRPTDC